MLELKRFVQRFNGSSVPSEIETTDGTQLVLKMRGAGNGPQSLLAEFLVNRACHAMGWQVPDAVPVNIAKNFPWTFGTDEFDDILQRSSGVNLGLQFIPGATPPARGTVLPIEVLERMQLIDAVFLNYDRLAQSENVLIDPAGNYWLIDHGSCQFLDEAFSRKPLMLPPRHCLHGQQLGPIDLTSAEAVVRQCADFIEEIPVEWLRDLKIDHAFVTARLNDRLSVIQGNGFPLSRE